MKDWRNDPEAHREWERRHRTLIIVPAVPLGTEVERGKFEPALWDIDPEGVKPRPRVQAASCLWTTVAQRRKTGIQ